MMPQAVARARVKVMIREALDPATSQRVAALEAVRAVCLIDTHRLLDGLGEREEALSAAVAALVVMLALALDGCIHNAPGILCEDCQRHAREALAVARRSMIHDVKEGLGRCRE
jgi:hypothetical protein